MWPAIAGPSTILASMVFHCAPSAADPCAVIRSTESEGTSDGGICGAGGGGGGAAGGGGVAAGACADAIVDIVTGIAASTAQASRPRIALRIDFLPFADHERRQRTEALLWHNGRHGTTDKPNQPGLAPRLIAAFVRPPIIGKKNRLIVLRTVEWVQNLDGFGDRPVQMSWVVLSTRLSALSIARFLSSPRFR